MTEHPAHDRDNDWLDRVWRSAPPPPPDDEAWAGVLARIQARLPAPGQQPPSRVRRGSRHWNWSAAWVGCLAASAAALFLAVGVVNWLPPGPGSKPADPVQPFPVASDDDVEILSMDADDDRAILVGRRPFSGPLVLATAGEVFIDDTGHDVEVRVPEDWKAGQPAAPMIIMPLDGTGR